MSNQPLYVTIKDACNVGRSLTWLAKGAKWLSPGGSLVLDYDPWSCASDAQRVRIASAISSGSVTMTINVLNDVGDYIAVPYCPGSEPKAPFIDTAAPAPVAAEPTRKTQPAQVYRQTDSGSHTVVAGVNKFANRYKLNAVDVTPPGGAPDAYGFAKIGDAAPEGADDGLKKTAGIVDKEASAAIADATVAEPEIEQSDSGKFNALIADKKWTDAYKLLKTHFGEDKITFSQRSLQYIANWDALVAKYGLDE